MLNNLTKKINIYGFFLKIIIIVKAILILVHYIINTYI